MYTGRSCKFQNQFHNTVTMKCKYRVRWFSSKGAFLVLLWTLLAGIHSSLLVYLVTDEFHLVTYDPSATINRSLMIPLILIMFVSAPLSGWLADAKFGNYKVFRVGAVLLFISAVMFCLFMIMKELILEGSQVLKWTLVCFFFMFLYHWCLCMPCHCTASWSGSDA